MGFIRVGREKEKWKKIKKYNYTVYTCMYYFTERSAREFPSNFRESFSEIVPLPVCTVVLMFWVSVRKVMALHR